MACLAYKLMSDDELQHNAKLLVVVTNGLWDWYTHQVTNSPLLFLVCKRVQLWVGRVVGAEKGR